MYNNTSTGTIYNENKSDQVRDSDEKSGETYTASIEAISYVEVKNLSQVYGKAYGF